MVNPALVLQGGIFAALLLIASITDMCSRTIPDFVCAGIALAGLLRFDPGNLPGILIAAPFFLAALFGTTGGGDVKLTAAAGFLLGPQSACAAIIIGFSVMLPIYGTHWIAVRLRGKNPHDYPLAPFIAIGCISAYVITNFYGGII